MAINQIYAVGAALVDTEVTVSDSFLSGQGIEKGIMTLVDQSRQAELLDALNSSEACILQQSGGSACNSVVAAAQFGANSCFGGKVANDADGVLFAADLKQANVQFYSAQSKTGITGKCLVMITDDAERTMNTYLGVSDEFSEKEIDHNALIASEWFYIEGYLQTDDRRTIVVKTAVEKAKQHGIKIALSLSDPFVAEIFSDNLRTIIGGGVDLIFCNKDEALAFTQAECLKSAAEHLKAYAKTFAITDGAKGALVYDGKELISVPAVKAKAVNTNGAGDMFAGAFLYGITAGKDFKTAAELANKAAAMVVERFGPRLEAKDFIQLKAS